MYAVLNFFEITGIAFYMCAKNDLGVSFEGCEVQVNRKHTLKYDAK